MSIAYRCVTGIILTVLVGMMGCSSDQRKEPENPPDVRIAEEPPQPEDPNPVLPKEPDSKKEQTTRPRAVFMGTEAFGKRFCIIADASNSMKGAPLDQLKKEILTTLDDLKPGSQFYVVFFHKGPVPMPSPSWLDAGKENVDKVRPFIQNITTFGKTNPNSSFEYALRLDPRPDVIFFMTDGALGENTPALLDRINSTEPRVAVHTIMFSRWKGGAPKGVATLRTIAEKNNGTYRHVNQK